MTQIDDTSHLGALGVTIVQLAVERDLRWIFRRVEHRVGIDAEVEVVLPTGEATGWLLALQIKCGASFFNEPTNDGWKFRGELKHLRYWEGHNLAVVVVIVDPEEHAAYWAAIDTEVVRKTKRGWWIEIPRTNLLTPDAIQRWMTLAWCRDPGHALHRYCDLHATYIDALDDDRYVGVEVAHYQNKMRGQSEIEVIWRDREGTERKKPVFLFAGSEPSPEFIEKIFPWCAAEIDEDFYELHEDEPPPEAVFQDDESPGGYYIIQGEDNVRPVGTIRPYGEHGSGEVASYRFVLSLNAIGRAYALLKARGRELQSALPRRLAAATWFAPDDD